MSKRKREDEKTDKSDIEDQIDLQTILAFDSSLKESVEAVEEAFDTIADRLLNRCVLVAGGQRFRLAEIEFYFNGGPHQDVFTHGSSLQHKTSGQWYFHTQGSKEGAYKGGTYKGLDITMGVPGGGAGGILLRAFHNIEAGTLMVNEGPCILVDTILCANSVESIRELVALGTSKKSAAFGQPKFHLSITSSDPDNSVLYIESDDELEEREIFKSPRVGLTLKGKSPEEKMKFLMKPYRYLTLPKLIKKNKSTMAIALSKQGRDAQTIQTVLKSNKAIDYLKSYKTGKLKGKPERFIVGKKWSVSDLCEVYGAIDAKFEGATSTSGDSQG